VECSVGPRTVMVNVKGALVSRDVLVVFGQWDMGTMQHMISGDGLPWNDPLDYTHATQHNIRRSPSS
jgi:hypothetical protein